MTNRDGIHTDGTFHLYGRQLFRVLILVCTVFLIYSKTLDSPFLFDDLNNIVGNPAIKDFSYFLDLSKLEGISAEFNKPLFRTRYMGYLTFAMNYAVGGLDVRGYHLINILIHICNTVLLYWMLSLVFRSPLFRRDNKMVSIPLVRSSFVVIFSAILFAVHPLQTQAITYIVQRFSSLATLFYLLSIVAYMKFRLHTDPSGFMGKKGLYAISLLSAILAMKTKEFSVSLPVILALIEILFFDETARRKALYLLPFVLSTLIIPLSLAGTGLAATKNVGLDETAAYMSGAKDTISRNAYLLTQFRVIVTYIRLLFFPVEQNIDYDYPIYTSFFSFPVIISFILLLAILSLGIYLYNISGNFKSEERYRLRLISFGIFWFFVTLAPESSIVPINDVIFEHRVYLPSIGFFIALTASFELIVRRWEPRIRGLRQIFLYSMILLAVGLSAATYARNMVWASDVSLLEDTAKKSPKKARPHSNLGATYFQRGLTDMAIDEYLTALKIKPDYADSRYNLGIAYQKKKLIDQAITEYLIALRINPDFANAHNNLGNIYLQKGQHEKAIGEYISALRIKPDHTDARFNLGWAYEKQGQLNEAKKEYLTTLKINPEYAAANKRLGLVCKKQGFDDKELSECLATLSIIDTDSAEAHFYLGNAYQQEGQLEKAIHELSAALRIRPEFAEARYNLGYAYATSGRINEAIKEFQEILRINPNDMNARKNINVLIKEMEKQ